jgi:hypothetical protein
VRPGDRRHRPHVVAVSSRVEQAERVVGQALDRDHLALRRHQQQPGERARRPAGGQQDAFRLVLARGLVEQVAHALGQTLDFAHHAPPVSAHRGGDLRLEHVDQVAADRRRRPPPGEVQRRRGQDDSADDDGDEGGAQADLAVGRKAHRPSG